MIVRELGIVIGKIDDKTFDLIDSESDKLTGLVTDLVKNGINVLQAQEAPLQKGQASGDVEAVITTASEYFIDALETRLLIAGFEVQTA